MSSTQEVELSERALSTSGSAARVRVDDADDVCSRQEPPEPRQLESCTTCLAMWRQTLTLRQMIGMVVAPVVVIITVVTEEGSMLEKGEQHRLLGVLSLVAVLYLTEAVPLAVTALMIGPLIVLFRACRPVKIGGKDVLCQDLALPPYFSDVIFLLLGTSFLATSMQLHKSDQRLVQWMTNLSFARGRPVVLRFVLTFLALLMAFFLSAPAMMSIFLPILLNISGAEMGQTLADPNAELMLKGNILCVLYAVLAGCMSTRLSPSVVSAVAVIEKAAEPKLEVGFLQYMAVGVPAAVLVTFLGLALNYATIPSQTNRRTSLARASISRTCSTRWAWGEKVTSLCWALALLLWLLPSFSKFELSNGAAAIFASAPLFLVPDVGKECRSPVLPWDAAMRGAGWSSLFLAGGGISLGKLMMQTGLAKVLADNLLTLTGISDVLMLTVVTCFLTTFTTEFLSNMAAINLLTPIIFSMGKEITMAEGCDMMYSQKVALMPALIVPMAASCSFMMPWASPMNAAAYQSGHVPIGQMMTYGLAMNVFSGILLVLICITLIPLVWPPGMCKLEA